MKTIKTLIIIFIVIGILITIKFIFFPTPAATQGGPGGGKGKGGGGPVPVDVYITQPTSVDNRLFVSGTIRANEEVKLVTEAAGKVTGIYFKEGGQVSKGQLLVKLNDADLRAQYKKLEVQEKLLASQEQRLAKLLEAKGISQEEYENTLSQLNAIRADMEVNKALLDKTTIRAPFSGRIGIKNISEGSYVSPSTVIAMLEQSDPVKIDFYVPEKYASLVQLGDTFSFSLEGQTEKHISKVSAIEPSIDATTRTLLVRATTPNKKQELLPGAFARVNFLLDHEENAIMIPTEALIPVLTGKKVFVVRKGKAQEVMVTIGVRTESSIQITSGLQAGDTLITRGIMQVKNGSDVKILNLKKNK